MAAQAPLYYLFPSEQRLTDLLTLNFLDKKELKALNSKTIKAIAEFFADKVLEQEQIPGKLQDMTSQIKSENLTETILGKIKDVFKVLQQLGSIPYSSVDPNGINLTNADLAIIARRAAFLRSM